MKQATTLTSVLFIFTAIMIFPFAGCMKEAEPVKYKLGTFPDTIYTLTNLNSPYDDYNTGLYQMQGYLPLVFSSNRGSNGGQFDLVQGLLYFLFDQSSGKFSLEDGLTNDTFLASLLARVNTGRDEFGPYPVYSTLDGYEYLILSSVNNEGNLDLIYTKNRPYFGYDVPLVEGPYSVSILNTSADEAYFCFNARQDSAYFCSNAGGDFDIYMLAKSDLGTIDTWLNLDYSSPVEAGNINSTSDDKCPYIYRRVMVFTSDRPGGFGGYDLYYSTFKEGSWSSPVNMGPDINTEWDEYRPVIGGFNEYTNPFLIFSSDRPGGKGGFDLYFTGLDLPE